MPETNDPQFIIERQRIAEMHQHARDRTIIAFLLFCCAVFFLTSVGGVNIGEKFSEIIGGSRIDTSKLLQWGIVVLALGVFLGLVRGNYRLAAANLEREQQVEESRQRAHAAFEVLDRKFDNLEKRDSAGLDR